MTDAPPVVLGLAGDQPHALAEAMAEASRRRVGLRVVHAIWLPLGVPADQDTATTDAGRAVLERARSFVDQAPSSPPVEYVLSTRPPVPTLMTEAEDAGCVVVGTDDVPWFERMLGGEVASWLARRAPCEVMVVPENPPHRAPTHDVVLALDVDTMSDVVWESAFEQAELRRARLHVLHVVPALRGHERSEQAAARLHELVAQGIAGHPDVRVVANVVVGEADDACLRASAHAGLLVLGRPRPVTIGRWWSHPVATRVLRDSRCPVLLVPGAAHVDGARPLDTAGA